MRQLFLDCDGVLADFNAGAEIAFGMHPRKFEDIYGTENFWHVLEATPDFYTNLPRMEDAYRLYTGCMQLGYRDPIILTGLPLGTWAKPQKLTWRDKHFSGVEMVCCLSAEKIKHMKPGDILIDDWAKYKDKWIDAGGIFIHHKNAIDSLIALGEIQ